MYGRALTSAIALDTDTVSSEISEINSEKEKKQ
jgi:hypothetical protein